MPLTRRRTRLLVLALALAATAALPAALPAAATTTPPTGDPSTSSAATLATTTAPTAARPLTGLVIAVDPGHQLGNENPAFRRYMAQTRWNGYIRKNCNTTGTATNSGYPEATFTWKVSLRLKAKLEALGATVRMTRSTNSYQAWGPCTWDRGTFGKRVGAALEVAVHGDGAASAGHGFFVIAPGYLKGWTDDVYASSQRLARAMKAGMTAVGATPSTYIRGAIWTTKEMTGLNFSDVPAIIVENGNMRNAGDAARMTSASGQDFYANALLRGIRTYLGR